MPSGYDRYGPPVILRVLAALLVLFLAYVAGRAVGIPLGIGPWITTALALAIAALAIRGHRGDPPTTRLATIDSWP